VNSYRDFNYGSGESFNVQTHVHCVSVFTSLARQVLVWCTNYKKKRSRNTLDFHKNLARMLKLRTRTQQTPALIVLVRCAAYATLLGVCDRALRVEKCDQFAATAFLPHFLTK
jgi:hypothetical protein